MCRSKDIAFVFESDAQDMPPSNECLAQDMPPVNESEPLDMPLHIESGALVIALGVIAASNFGCRVAASPALTAPSIRATKLLVPP